MEDGWKDGSESEKKGTKGNCTIHETIMLGQ